jgi:hypothetical protein
MRELIFVYNADAGTGNAILDSLHKTFSPGTYACKLCAVTYGMVSMKQEWKLWLDKQDVQKTFLHRDEYQETVGYPDIPLPVILLKDGYLMKEVVTAEDFETIDTIDQLSSRLEAVL